MKKLNYNEILEILKKHTTVENFCEEDYFLEVTEGFIFSKELQEKIDLHNKYEKEWELNGKKYKSDDPYYQQKQKYPKPYDVIHNEILTSLGLGEVEEIDRYGGEDCGSTYYSIKYFKDHDVYIKVSGWYQSHYGTDFEDWDSACDEVKPKTKTITVFE